MVLQKDINWRYTIRKCVHFGAIAGDEFSLKTYRPKSAEIKKNEVDEKLMNNMENMRI